MKYNNYISINLIRNCREKNRRINILTIQIKAVIKKFERF